jgi:ABC-2 type transport system permease protein
MKTFTFFFFLLKTSIRASLSLRKAFFVDAAMMLASNLIFFSMWGLFFLKFKDIDGWHFKEICLLMAIGSGAYGLMQVTMGGLKQLSRMIIEGDLEPFMTQPRNIFLYVAGSKSLAKGWGQLLTAVILVGFTIPITLQHILLIILSIVLGCLVFASIQIMAHSLVFWLGPVEVFAQRYCDALFLFVLYPSNIYSGWIKAIMFTLIPAGIIGYLPVELIRNFSWPQLVILLTSSTALFSLACWIFHLGLRKYATGN